MLVFLPSQDWKGLNSTFANFETWWLCFLSSCRPIAHESALKEKSNIYNTTTYLTSKLVLRAGAYFLEQHVKLRRFFEFGVELFCKESTGVPIEVWRNVVSGHRRPLQVTDCDDSLRRLVGCQGRIVLSQHLIHAFQRCCERQLKQRV